MVISMLRLSLWSVSNKKRKLFTCLLLLFRVFLLKWKSLVKIRPCKCYSLTQRFIRSTQRREVARLKDSSKSIFTRRTFPQFLTRLNKQIMFCLNRTRDWVFSRILYAKDVNLLSGTLDVLTTMTRRITCPSISIASFKLRTLISK